MKYDCICLSCGNSFIFREGVDEYPYCRCCGTDKTKFYDGNTAMMIDDNFVSSVTGRVVW